MTTDECTRQDVEACHTAFPASVSFPRWQYQAAKHHSQPTILYSDQQYAEFCAEKSAFFPPEAPQQEPEEILVPVFYTRSYHAVPDCVKRVQRAACLVGGLPSPWPQRCSDVGNLG